MNIPDHHENFEKLYNLNKYKLGKIQNLLNSLDKIEISIQYKLEYHKNYVKHLERTFKQSLDSYHNICKNLVPQNEKNI